MPKKSSELSITILAGGRNTRMGSDKAFLTYKNRSFISLISEEASRVSRDVIVVIGEKDEKLFQSVLTDSVRIFNDAYDVHTPVGGMLTAFDYLQTEYTAILACDSPLVKSDVIRFLFDAAVSHSAAIPLWESGEIEPLCSVYHVQQAKNASLKAIREGSPGCKNMISYLPDVNYVPVLRLRAYDPALTSLLNINTPQDLLELERSVDAR